MSLTIVPIDDSDVSVDLFDPAIHPSLAGFLEGPEKSTPYALVLTNNLPQPIVGLTVRWIRTDDQENRPVATIRSDSFLYSRSPIVPAKGHLLVTPTNFQTPRPPGTHFIGATFRARGFNDRLDGSSGVTVSFDTIIFEDGHVLGPDESRTLASLEARKASGRDIAQRVRQAMANGENVQALLRSLSSEPADNDGPRRLWTARFAGTLIHTLTDFAGPTAQLDQLENLPVLPRFFRKQ